MLVGEKDVAHPGSHCIVGGVKDVDAEVHRRSEPISLVPWKSRILINKNSWAEGANLMKISKSRGMNAP